MAKEIAGLIKLQIKGGAVTLLPGRSALGSRVVNIMDSAKI